MKIRFQLKTSFFPVKSDDPEKLFFTCELSDTEKIKTLEKILALDADEKTILREIILYSLKFGECHIKYKRCGACVFFNHDFFIEERDTAIAVVFPRDDDVVFTFDLDRKNKEYCSIYKQAEILF